MRSISFTLLLAILAAAVCGAIGWRVREGNLDAIFGVPAVKAGERLYTDFQIADVARISVSAHGIRGEYVKTDKGWHSATAPHDRMDPRYAANIILFSLNLKVVDSADTDDINRDEVGLREDSIQIHLESASGRNLAKYRIGRRTPLLSENKQGNGTDGTVYIQPRERDRKDHVYICVGDIIPLFRDGMRFFRDHRPFYINQNYIRKIRIRGPEGEMTIDHPEPGDRAPWRITKPLDSATDRAAMVALLKGLAELGDGDDKRVSDRASVTLPGAEASARSLQIGVTTFGSENETVFEIHPPQTPDATEVLATVSDRPDTVFHFPRTPNSQSLVPFPVTVNDLRNHSLLNLDLASLRSVTLIPATGPRIRISGEPKRSWEVEINGKIEEANQNRLVTLLETLTSARALKFASDAATDFTPWGLNKPILIVEVGGESGSPIRINFGMNKRGELFANRQGTSTVMWMDEKILSSISVKPYEWRHSLLWSINTTDLRSIERTVKDATPVVFNYDDFNEKWTGKMGDDDVTDRIDPLKAKFMLDSIVSLNVTRWLAIGDEDASAALTNPVFTMKVAEAVVDEFGDQTGTEKIRTLVLAPNPTDSSYYGKMSDEPHPFIIDRETAVKIGTDPLERNP
jgi:hypothetical protein